jgi:hypothetical protein
MTQLWGTSLAWKDVSASFVSSTGLGAQSDDLWRSFVSTASSTINFLTPVARAVTLPDSFFAPANSVVDKAAAAVGMSHDPATVRFVLVLLAIYPVAYAFARVRNVAFKHFASAAFGIVLAQWVFGISWFNSLFSSLVTYVILLLAQSVPAIGPYRHYLVMLWMMGYMTCAHLWRLEVDYLGWSMDYTGAQMILTIKLTSLAFNLLDGAKAADYRKEMEVIAERVKAGTARSDETLRARNMRIFIERSVSSVPDLISYLGYVYLPTSFFAGPAFEYTYYSSAVDASIFFDKSKEKHDFDWSGRVSSAVRKLGIGLFFLALTLVAMTQGITASQLHDEGFLSSSTWFTRVGWFWVVLFFARCKYYFAWLVAEGATNLAGFGYVQAAAGRDGKVVPANWERIKNMDVIGFETAPDITAGSKYWNMGTGNWLGMYCGARVPESSKLLAVYFLSAFWHGFYPVSFACTCRVCARMEMNDRQAGRASDSPVRTFPCLSFSLPLPPAGLLPDLPLGSPLPDAREADQEQGLPPPLPRLHRAR